MFRRNFLSAWQAHRLLGVSYKAACAMVKRGEIRTITVNGRKLIPQSEIRRFLTEGPDPNPNSQDAHDFNHLVGD